MTTESPDALAAAEHVAQILAVAVGGMWVYYTYFRGRTFRPRLEPNVTGAVVRRGDDSYILAKASLKNVGLSKVTLKHLGMGLSISVFDGDTLPFFDINWNEGYKYSVFDDHKWIEPAEEITSIVFVMLPSKQVAVQLHLRIDAGKYTWHAEDVVLATESDPEGAS